MKSHHDSTKHPPTPSPNPEAAPAPKAIAIPSEADVAAAIATLDQVRALLGASAAPMTSEQRRRVLRTKKGGEVTAALIAGLGKQYDVQIPGVDPDSIGQHALLVQRLQPLETKMRVVASLVTDTVANAKAQAWEGTTALYTALRRASRRNATLQKEILPATAFFKRGKTAKPAAAKAGAATKTAPSPKPPEASTTPPTGAAPPGSPTTS